MLQALPIRLLNASIYESRENVDARVCDRNANSQLLSIWRHLINAQNKFYFYGLNIWLCAAAADVISDYINRAWFGFRFALNMISESDFFFNLKFIWRKK